MDIKLLRDFYNIRTLRLRTVAVPRTTKLQCCRRIIVQRDYNHSIRLTCYFCNTVSQTSLQQTPNPSGVLRSAIRNGAWERRGLSVGQETEEWVARGQRWNQKNARVRRRGNLQPVAAALSGVYRLTSLDVWIHTVRWVSKPLGDLCVDL